MNLYKIVEEKEVFYVMMLTYNPRVWCSRQWKYSYISDHYPTSDTHYAKKFKTREDAEKWIKDSAPT